MTPRERKYHRRRKVLPCGCIAKVKLYARSWGSDYGMEEYTHECDKCRAILYHWSYGNVLLDLLNLN